MGATIELFAELYGATETFVGIYQEKRILQFIYLKN